MANLDHPAGVPAPICSKDLQDLQGIIMASPDVQDELRRDDDIFKSPGTIHLLEAKQSETGEPLSITKYPIPTNDPNDPLNWPMWRKNFNFFFVFAFSTAIFTTLVLQTIYWQQINAELKITYQHLNWSVAVQSTGLTAGCVLFIPFTKKYGRRLTYVLSMAVLSGMYWWTSRMQTTAELYVTNLVIGLASALNETLAQMTIADLYFVHQRGRANSWYMTAVSLGNLMPIAGGAQASTEGWRASYYTAAAFFTALTLLSVVFFEETKYIPVMSGVGHEILAENVGEFPQKIDEPNKVARADVDDNVSVECEKASGAPPPPPPKSWRERLVWITKTDDSLWKLFKAPYYTCCLPAVIWSSIQYAAVVAWLTVEASIISQYFSMPPYLFDTLGIGAMSVPAFLGSVIGSFYCGILGDWLIAYLSKKNGGIYEPEMRLYPVVLPTILMPAGLIMFGVTLEKQMHWILPAVGMTIFATGMGAVGDAAFSYCIDSYRELTGEAFVMVAFWRNILSIAIPFTIQPWTEMGLTIMHVMIAVIQFACIVTFIPMIIWGKKMRTKMGPYYHGLVSRQSVAYTR